MWRVQGTVHVTHKRNTRGAEEEQACHAWEEARRACGGGSSPGKEPAARASDRAQHTLGPPALAQAPSRGGGCSATGKGPRVLLSPRTTCRGPGSPSQWKLSCKHRSVSSLVPLTHNMGGGGGGLINIQSQHLLNEGVQTDAFPRNRKGSTSLSPQSFGVTHQVPLRVKPGNRASSDSSFSLPFSRGYQTN